VKAVAAAALLLLCGCVNVYTRCPLTERRIKGVYQCTKEAASLSYVVMFPQTMGWGNGAAFVPENLVTVPVGCLGMCDAAAEAVLDTVFLPADAWLASRRKK